MSNLLIVILITVFLYRTVTHRIDARPQHEHHCSSNERVLHETGGEDGGDVAEITEYSFLSSLIRESLLPISTPSLIQNTSLDLILIRK